MIFLNGFVEYCYLQVSYDIIRIQPMTGVFFGYRRYFLRLIYIFIVGLRMLLGLIQIFYNHIQYDLRNLLIWRFQLTTISCRIQDAMHIENMRFHTESVTRHSSLLTPLLTLIHL
jgi:hypothetical protein